MENAVEPGGEESATPPAAPTPRKRRRWIGPLVSALTVVVALVATEGALRKWGRDYPDPYAIYKPEKEPSAYIPSQHARWEPGAKALETEAEPGLPGMSGKHVWKTNNTGFRGDDLASPKPEGEFRVFVVGGSTTECFYLDEEQSIAGVLQRELRAKTPPATNVVVENAGKDGDKSYDHVAMIVHRLVFLEPDLIVVFSGINDLLAQLAGKDYLHYPKPVPEKSRLPLLIKMTLTEFQLGRRIYYVLPRSDKEQLEEIPTTSNYRKLVARRKARPLSYERPRVDERFYASNLRTIAGTAKANGIPVVFMTQPSTWGSKEPGVEEWQWLQVLLGDRVYPTDFMDQALESLNDAARRVGTEQGVPVYDLSRTLPKSLEVMYDDCHLNAKGAETTGVGLAGFLLEKKLVPSR
ncbi:SGNH/GDSL hydrolase family protein [bacterium]|nr:SGNH/GDSL hydrolase family protein [bacterium]